MLKLGEKLYGFEVPMHNSLPVEEVHPQRNLIALSMDTDQEGLISNIVESYSSPGLRGLHLETQKDNPSHSQTHTFPKRVEVDSHQCKPERMKQHVDDAGAAIHLSP